MIVVNLWGPPGSGKSTTASGLFFLMKINKFKVELVTEYAKELVWDRNEGLLKNQMAVFAEQYHRQERMESHNLDFIITDSPLPLSMIYRPEAYLETFDQTVMETFNSHNNLNYFLRRTQSFEKFGRLHNEPESNRLGGLIEGLMKEHDIEYTSMEADPRTPERILADIEARSTQRLGHLPLALPSDAPAV